MDELFDLCERTGGLYVNLGHNSIADWVLTIKTKDGFDFMAQDCDRFVVISKGYAALTDFLSEKRGGY